MDKAELKLRESIINACRSMNGLGINQGTSGNISARYGKLMLITPSGVPYEELKAKDIVTTLISGKGDKWNGALAPSSEWRFHLRILQDRPEAGSVVHTHSTYATTLAICNKPIPAIHYMVAAAGGPDIRVAPYATYGTEELSDLAMKALEGRTCCLLRNHGVIATGVGRAARALAGGRDRDPGAAILPVAGARQCADPAGRGDHPRDREVQELRPAPEAGQDARRRIVHGNEYPPPGF